jgi:hypothetical protein
MEPIQLRMGHADQRPFDRLHRKVVATRVQHQATIPEFGRIMDDGLVEYFKYLLFVVVPDQLLQGGQTVAGAEKGVGIDFDVDGGFFVWILEV